LFCYYKPVSLSDLNYVLQFSNTCLSFLTVPQNPSCYGAEQASAAVKPENMRHALDSTLHDVFNNGGSSLNASIRNLTEMSARGNRISSPQSMLSSQNSSLGLIQGINGGMIKSEPGYSGSPPYIFGPDGTVLEACPTMGDAAVTSFNSVDSNSHSMNRALLDPDISSFGVLGQISRNLSLSDLTADFSQSSGMFSFLFIMSHRCFCFFVLACFSAFMN
jgi:hypothetical protein